MKKVCVWLLLVWFVAALCGCAPQALQPSREPQQEVGSPSLPPTDVLPGEEAGPSAAPSSSLGDGWVLEQESRIEIKPCGNPLYDENGLYRVYKGGERHLPYIITTEGTVADQGVGMLLFLDGMPQPYKVGENGEEQYLHTFYPTSGEPYIADLFFTPVTGQQGDDLELYAVTILTPEHELAEGGAIGFLYTSGAVISSTRLKYLETPPVTDPVPKESRIISLRSFREEVTQEEIGNWSEEELMLLNEAHLYVNGTDDELDTVVSGISEEEPVSIRYEVWGSPYVYYDLVLFLDHQPIVSSEGTRIPIHVLAGEKTVVEAELDLTGFDGEAVLYAVLVPRNYWTTEVQTSAFLDCSRTFFLCENIP